MPDVQLTPFDHNRDVTGMTYVYPVVSRRAQGVSVGINLNVNNACNWRCIYCQVPNLTRGGPPPIDLDRLETELRTLLTGLIEGDFMVRHVPEGMRRISDIALSGNGEPTSAPEFPEVITRLGAVMRDFDLLGKIRLVLISNGSLIGKAYVQDGLDRMAALGGEVWFKLDRATAEGVRQANNSEISPERALRNLKTACAHCPTWIQTCMFALDGQPPAEGELDAYLAALQSLVNETPKPRGVLLYGLARTSYQPEAPRLSALPEAWLQDFAKRIRATGFETRVFP